MRIIFKGCLLAANIGLNTEALIVAAVFFVVVLAFGLYCCSTGRKQPDAPDIPTAPPPDDPRLLKIAELGKEATAAKKTDPDRALEILQEVEHLQREMLMHPKILLDTRLRMATVLYENNRLDEAETMLLGELANARRMTISAAEIADADRRFFARLGSLQQDKTAPIEEWKRQRADSEWPDFERNLYCLAIYSKLKTLYTKMKRPDRAFIFAMAEVYAKYENGLHNPYCSNPESDFTAVEKILHQCGQDGDLPQWRVFLHEYTVPEPTCERCWAMIDAVEKTSAE